MAILAAVLAAAIAGSGGFGLTVMGMRVSAHHPVRAAGLAVASLLVAIAIVGRRRAFAMATGYLAALSGVLRRQHRLIAAVTHVLDRYWLETLAASVV